MPWPVYLPIQEGKHRISLGKPVLAYPRQSLNAKNTKLINLLWPGSLLLLNSMQNMANHSPIPEKQAFRTSPMTLDYQRVSHIHTLLERFANNSRCNPSSTPSRLSADSCEDEGLHNWLRQVVRYSRKWLLELGYILHPDSNICALQLKEDSCIHWNDKYKSHFDNVFDQIGGFPTAMGDVSPFQSAYTHPTHTFCHLGSPEHMSRTRSCLICSRSPAQFWREAEL